MVVPEELTDRTQGCVADQKDCVDAGLAQVKITVVEACVKICRYFFGDIQRQRGVCAGDNLEGIGDKFPSSGCFFGCLDNSFAGDNRLSANFFDCGEHFGADFFLGDGYL